MNAALIRISLLVAALIPQAVWADGPADNHPDKVRRVPRLGIEVPVAEREALQTKLDALGKLIAELQASKSPMIADLLPDVQIYHRAVDVALKHQEFFAANEIAAARELLDEGITRAKQLGAGKPEWPDQTGRWELTTHRTLE